MSDREFIAVFHYDNGGTNRCGAEPYRYAEEIVRCKDCVVFGTHGKNTDICPMWHNTHIDPYRDFCSRGERRTDE